MRAHAQALPGRDPAGARRAGVPAPRLAGRGRGPRARRASHQRRDFLAGVLVLRRGPRLVALGLVLGANHALPPAAGNAVRSARARGADLDPAPARLRGAARRGRGLLPGGGRLHDRRAPRGEGPARVLRVLVRRGCGRVPRRRVGEAQAGARRLPDRQARVPEPAAYPRAELHRAPPERAGSAHALDPRRHDPRVRRALRCHGVRGAGGGAGPGLGRDRAARGGRLDRGGERARLRRHAFPPAGLLRASRDGGDLQPVERQPRRAHPARGAARAAAEPARDPGRLDRAAPGRDPARGNGAVLRGGRRGRRHPRRVLDRHGARRDPEPPPVLCEPCVFAERRLRRQPRRERVRRAAQRVARGQNAARSQEEGAGDPRRRLPLAGGRRDSLPRPRAALPPGGRSRLRPRHHARAVLGARMAEARGGPQPHERAPRPPVGGPQRVDPGAPSRSRPPRT